MNKKHIIKYRLVGSIFPISLLFFHLAAISNEEDVTAVTDSSGNTLRIRRDTNRMPVRVVAPDNQVIFYCPWFRRMLQAGKDGRKQAIHH